MSPASVKGNSSSRSFFRFVKGKVSPANVATIKQVGSSPLTTSGPAVAPLQIKPVQADTRIDPDVQIVSSSSPQFVFKSSSSSAYQLQVKDMLPTTDPNTFSKVEPKDVFVKVYGYYYKSIKSNF